MVKLSAAQVVDKLLEYAGNTPVPVPAGGANDPWRQGGFKKFKFTAKDVFRDRPGSVPRKSVIKIPVKTPGESPAKPAFKHDLSTRMQWKPPVEQR